MNQKFSYSVLIGTLILGLIVGIIRPLDFNNIKVLGLNNARKSESLLKANFFAEKEFYEGVLATENLKSSYNGEKVYGGVIPHHLLPGYILSDFFTKLAAQNPKKIIIIGPNHNEIGGVKPITSLANWQTQFGQLNSDYTSIASLADEGILVENNDVMLDEHSIGGILHYIKYYLPNTTIIPIILSGTNKEEDISALSSSLEKYIDEDTVIVASVDFSHYLSSPEAIESDEVTKKVLEEFDYEHLYRLNNDYMDSPPSIGLLLNLMEKKEAKKMNLLFNTNSGQLLGNDTIQTTSYFSIFFSKK
jgi:hypothetical protein